MSASNTQTAALADWERRLADIMEMMREMSQHRDPQAMVAAYGRRAGRIYPIDRFIAISRRDIEPPKFRVTRYSGWKEAVNPWKEKDRLPVLAGGLLGELLYDGEPRIIDDLRLAPDDPAAEYLAGQRSLMAIPHLDGGMSVNMVVSTRSQPGAFDKERFPDVVATSILFGRSTHNLVLAAQVREAYDLVDRELQIVGDIQRSLLPAELPEIPTMKLAAHYQTSRRAGGDYYDFFPLPDGRWGILIADVSGHGTPAAVTMAVTHSIAHMYPGSSAPPSDMLNFVSRHLAPRYTQSAGSFVTALYAIYDPRSRELVYSSAGHNPARLKHCAGGRIESLDGARNYPLAVSPDTAYEDVAVQLRRGDQIVFYTDGITEATDPDGRMFGVARLDAVLEQCRDDPREIVAAILGAVEQFSAGQPVIDDRTVVVAKVV
jgi:sigma-B regulation protein RsbU (phosphoserine phosphatase)